MMTFRIQFRKNPLAQLTILLSQTFRQRDMSNPVQWTNESLQWHHNERNGILNQRRLNGLFAQPFVWAQIKKNIKALRHWPLWGEFTGARWIPSQRGSNAENVSIWWRHHVQIRTLRIYHTLIVGLCSQEHEHFMYFKVPPALGPIHHCQS